MPTVTICVTPDVRTAVSQQGDHQKQLAVTHWSPDLKSTADTASRTSKFPILLGGFILLTLGDTHAFWRNHQKDPVSFDCLYSLLERNPGRELTVTW